VALSSVFYTNGSSLHLYIQTLQELVGKSFDISKSFLDKFLALATRQRHSRGLSGPMFAFSFIPIGL